jgi:hypothetical protein
MGLRHSLRQFLAVVVGLGLSVSLDASAQQKSSVTFQAVDSLKAPDIAVMGRHGEFRSKSGPSFTYIEFNSPNTRERKDGKVCIGVVVGKLKSTGEGAVAAKVWASEGTLALDRLSTAISRSSDTATVVFGTSADYKACTDAAASCVASLPYIRISSSGEISSSSGKIGTATR